MSGVGQIRKCACLRVTSASPSRAHAPEIDHVSASVSVGATNKFKARKFWRAVMRPLASVQSVPARGWSGCCGLQLLS